MRKIIITVFLVIMMSSVVNADDYQEGEIYTFGRYEQNDNTEDGLEPIEWIILKIEDGRMMLISKYALDGQPFHDTKEPVTWGDCSLRKWLNSEFYKNAFSPEEQELILLSDVSNASYLGSIYWNSPNEDNTEDKLFLLSFFEATRFFDTQDSRKVKGTKYASSNGAKSWGITSVVIAESDWWLRSPGKYEHDASFIDVFGDPQTKVVTERIGVRPAMWIDFQSDKDSLPSVQYEKAVRLAEEKKYREAADIIESLGDYSDSKDLAKEYRYQQALQLMEAQEYGDAIELFVNLAGYKDSSEEGRKARYNYALLFQEAGEYEKAATLFGEAGQYEDSMERMKECFDKIGTHVYYFSDAEAVNTGYDNGYSNTNRIKKSDRHFGWRLGEFFMSDFTRRTEEDNNDNPIFIKTLGDSVTLWFDLEQDINALNGNKDLFIKSDKSGYNEHFGINKTDFGKGALIVTHTDYQNKQSKPVIYTDYLEAKDTTGADTKVVLNEEGDYEVALDYEIQDDDVSHILEKYGDYQIIFKFSIRNGNCMVYPFDVVTRDELQASSVTENGFYLDLAKSRYLDIDVKYSVLTEGIAGIIEDVRFNRPASDGDQYTDEGIYTISVSNRYTGESTVKTIFVGSEELLQEYIEKGFSIERLKE